ncbi:MAG: hypothetical protein OEU36_13010 [Gammaproteobacteria bacterium]|nr:hypothetical protein [Gammaproteobacteria bacterium]
MRTVISSMMGALLIGTAVFAVAQQEPQYVNQFFFLDASSGKLIPLEQANAVMKTKAKALGMGGASSFYEVKGKKSNVQFKAGQKMEFVVRGFSPQMDPTTMFKLAQLKVKKKNRRFEISKTGAWGVLLGVQRAVVTRLFCLSTQRAMARNHWRSHRHNLLSLGSTFSPL